MSWETLLLGDIYFMKNKGYDEIKVLLEKICEILELDTPKQFNENEYNKLYHSRLNKYGNYLIDHGDFWYLTITDINYSSHIDDEKLEELRTLLSKNKDLVYSADLSLYYLDEAHVNFNYDSTEENEEDVEDVE